MKNFIRDLFVFVKTNKIAIFIAVIVIFILNLNKSSWFESPDSMQEINYQFYATRLLIYLIILLFVIITFFLISKKQIDASDLIFVILNSLFQLGFNVYLILTLPSKVTRGYDMGIISIPFYSILGTTFAAIFFVFSYILMSIFKQEKVLKILASFILSSIVTFIYMKYFICNDSYYY